MMPVINTQPVFYAPPAIGRSPASAVTSSKEAAPPLDPVDISSFAVVDRNTDAGATKDPNKKSFKSMKDYIQYMLLMYAKLRDLKAAPGEIYVKLEDQQDLAKTQAAIDDAEMA